MPYTIPAFPLQPSANGRYLVDQNNVPFRVHGEASWDAHLQMTVADQAIYVADRSAKGCNALFTYIHNPVPYFNGSVSPWMQSLGGSGTGALPFSLNASGGTWDGDPTFGHWDAAFSSPNDAFHEAVGVFVDRCAVQGIVVVLCFMYTGFSLGLNDGWYKTVGNTANTQSVCSAYGAYLANGHGTFQGFKGRKNIIWVAGGDTFPTVGSETATRLLKIYQGMQSNGCNQPLAMHWQHDYLPNDQTDFSSSLTSYCAYSHGQTGATPPVIGPTYAEARSIYGSQSPSRPAFLIETTYFGDAGLRRQDHRYLQWGATLSCAGGAITGYSPVWGWVHSADGSSDLPGGGITTAWKPSHVYPLNFYSSLGGNWYRVTAGGTSASSGGPTGTGTSITDGGVTWTYVAACSSSLGGMLNLLSQPAMLDHEVLGAFMGSIPWQNLVPSGLGAMPTLITGGQGTFATWSDQSAAGEVGGMDWITAAATGDGEVLVAYVPHDHSGSFTLSLAVAQRSVSGWWIDPVTGARNSAVGPFAAGSSQTLTAPAGPNADGSNDWGLLLLAAGQGGSSGRILVAG